MARRNAMHMPSTPEEEFGQSDAEYYDAVARENQSADEPPAEGTPEHFTRKQVEQILTEREEQLQRHFQSQMTPVWQERSELRERMDELERSIKTAAQMGPSPAQAAPPLDPGKREEWKDIHDGEELYDKTLQMIQALAPQQKPAAEEAWQMRDDRSDERDEMLGELALNNAINTMRTAYPWMNDGHVRQVLQVAHDRDVYDFDLLASSIYGPPGSKPRDPNVLGLERTGYTHDYQLPPRPEQFRSQSLVGTSRNAAASASPKQLELRRGREGYGDAETGLLQWVKDDRKE